MRLGMGEMLLILAVVLLLFGSTKLPQLGEALGKGIKSFKRATSEPDEEPAPEQPRLAEGVTPAPSAEQKPAAGARR